MPDFKPWFSEVTGCAEPHPWQARLGEATACVDRLIRIPTGFGKTAGTILAWLFHRVVRDDITWPTRLAFCLPMRTLVEQTEASLHGWLERAGLASRVGIHVLMGGSGAGPWRLHPERPAVLVGTQDMLLSRALNRGYGSGRGAWPMELGLLHNDVLWVSDEVQLQDVGLATSAQLAAFRAQDDSQRGGALRPARTWWMSATLQPRWLETVDHAPRVPDLAARMDRIPGAERDGGLWAVRKKLERELVREGLAKPPDIAALVRDGHAPNTLTLVVLNTVKRAVDVFDALSKELRPAGKRGAAPNDNTPDLRLVHSRFRGAERRGWAATVLSRHAPLPASGLGRILVCTQVVEAGVDVSARLLVTDLAPWPSLVQRFGRAARYEGENGRVVVVGAAPDDKLARPYDSTSMQSASEALAVLLDRFGDASPSSLERFEEGLPPEKLRTLYPYSPLHVLRRRDIDELFDTSVDLSGADVDVSRFIRSGEERDVLVFWRDLPKDLDGVRIEPPRRDELCPVPIGDMKDWLKKRRPRALRFDYLEASWRPVDATRLAPGTEILVPSNEGGYSTVTGWTPASGERVDPVAPPAGPPPTTDDQLERASKAEDDDALSEIEWKTIAVHGRETGEQAKALAGALRLDAELGALLDLAGRWHDAGKAHEVFQDAIQRNARDAARPLGSSRELAKAPEPAWRRPAYPTRPGFRHELVSTLALFELLRRTKPDHDALLGPHREVFEAMGLPIAPLDDASRIEENHPVAAELAALDGPSFDLLAWLVCTHHGKVRSALSSTVKDQESGEDRVHGVRTGDKLPPLSLATGAGATGDLPELDLSLSLGELGLGARYGASWGERVAGLLQRHGPFKLAYLEALLRAADVRATIHGGLGTAEEEKP